MAEEQVENGEPAQTEAEDERDVQRQQQAAVSRHEQLIDDNPGEDYHEYKNLDAEPGYEPWEPPKEKVGLLEKIKNKLSGARAPTSEGVSGMKEIVDEQAYQRKAADTRTQAKAQTKRTGSSRRSTPRRSTPCGLKRTPVSLKPPVSMTGADYRPRVPQTPIYGGMMSALSEMNSFLKPITNFPVLPNKGLERVTMPLPRGPPEPHVTIPLYVSSYQRPLEVDVGQSKFFRRSSYTIDTDIGQSRLFGERNEKQEECVVSRMLGLRRR